MTAYQDFVSNITIQPGKISRLWELEIQGRIENLVDFCREFLSHEGYLYTGYDKDSHKAVFNGQYVFGGCIQEGNKVAIRITEI